MNNNFLTADQIQSLAHSWKNAVQGSEEQKLIEDLFVITDTPLPGKNDSPERKAP